MTTIVYDAACEFCTRWVQRILRSDSKHVFAAVPNTTPGLTQQFSSLAGKDLTVSVWLIDEHGNAFAAAEAFYQIITRLPALKIFAVLWHIPPLRLLASWFYDLVAANHHRL